MNIPGPQYCRNNVDTDSNASLLDKCRKIIIKNIKNTNLKNKGDIFVRVVPIEELQAATVAFIPEKDEKF
jgi:hypothetical protein